MLRFLFVWQGRNLEKFWLAFWVKRSSKIHSEFNWPIVQFAKPRKIGKHTHCLLASPGGVKHGLIFWSKFPRKRSSFNIQKLFHFFTCILPDYMAHGIPKEFWKSSNFENMTAVFLLRCQNWLRRKISLICHWNIDSWKQKFTFLCVIVPKNDQNIV